MGWKKTLAQTRAEGRGVYLVIFCNAGFGCYHRSTMTVLHAITLWGESTKLDDLRLRCSVCGSREIEVRSDYPQNHAGRPIQS